MEGNISFFTFDVTRSYDDHRVPDLLPVQNLMVHVDRRILGQDLNLQHRHMTSSEEGMVANLVLRFGRYFQPFTSGT